VTSSASVRSAQRIVDGLAPHGVRYVFGIPGGKIFEFWDALAEGTASELHLSLPRTGPFLSADLSPADTSAQIKQTEDN
jgi:hypothetical protein